MIRLLSDTLFARLLEFLDATSVECLCNNLAGALVQNIPSADADIIYLYDSSRRQLVSQGSYGYTGNNNIMLSVGEGIPGRCYALRKSLLFTSVEAVREQQRNMRPSSLDSYKKMGNGLPPILSMVVVPIGHKQRISGVIQLEHYNEEKATFNEADLSQLEELGSLVWLIIDYVHTSSELRNMKRSYRELLLRFISKSEEERKKIAREIHDDINQLLLSVRLNLEDLENALPAKLVELRKRVEVIRTHVNQAFSDLHALSLSLRPPAIDELGLPQALDWYIQNIFKEAGIPITLQVAGLHQRRPAPVIEMEFFRIVQEAVSNIIKHSQATAANIKLEYNRSQLILLIEDNGKGFDVNTVLGTSGNVRSLGLLGIRERAEMCGGSFNIDSAPGLGTRLKVEVLLSSYDWGAY